MLPTPANILDQLLGGFDVNQIGPTNSVDASKPDGLLFADVLALSSMEEGTPVGPGLDIPELLLSELPVPDVSRPVLPLAEQPALPLDLMSGDVNRKAKGGEINPAVIWPDESLSGDTPATRPLVTDYLRCNTNVQELFTIQKVDLESAVYRILDATVSGGKLELTIAAEGESAEPVRISIPIELMARGSDPAATDLPATGIPAPVHRGMPTRIPLIEPHGHQAAQFEQLLSKLNLKAIEVQIESVNASSGDEHQPAVPQNREQPVIIRLVAENSGHTVVLKSRMHRQDIEVGTAPKLDGTARPVLSRPSIVASKNPEGAGPTPSEPHFMTRPAAVPVNTVRQPVPLDPFEKPVIGEVPRRLEPPTLPWAASGEQDTMMTVLPRVRPEPLQVRFSLTETLAQTAKPSGQSVTIRIEPEQLGPARLYLSVRNEVLTARVTVETVVAKAAVENSLDQLADQLWRAGIQFDRIEVALSGGNNHDQLLDRGWAWSMGRRFRQANHYNRPAALETSVTPSLPLPPVGGYPAVEGVDLWA